MADTPEEIDPSRQRNLLAVEILTAVNVAAHSLAEIATIKGAERLDILEARAITSAKNTAIEGVSIEEDARLLETAVSTVRLIFEVARAKADKGVDS